MLAKAADWNLNLYLNEKNQTLGYKVALLTTPHLDIQLVHSKALTDHYGSTMTLVDPDTVKEAVFMNEEYLTNIKTDNDNKTVKDVINGDSGLLVELLERNHFIKINQ
jgi:hypothetical protein